MRLKAEEWNAGLLSGLIGVEETDSCGLECKAVEQADSCRREYKQDK